jgi:hypothetical protein
MMSFKAPNWVVSATLGLLSAATFLTGSAVNAQEAKLPEDLVPTAPQVLEVSATAAVNLEDAPVTAPTAAFANQTLPAFNANAATTVVTNSSVPPVRSVGGTVNPNAASEIGQNTASVLNVTEIKVGIEDGLPGSSPSYSRPQSKTLALADIPQENGGQLETAVVQGLGFNQQREENPQEKKSNTASTVVTNIEKTKKTVVVPQTVTINNAGKTITTTNITQSDPNRLPAEFKNTLIQYNDGKLPRSMPELNDVANRMSQKDRQIFSQKLAEPAVFQQVTDALTTKVQNNTKTIPGSTTTKTVLVPTAVEVWNPVTQKLLVSQTVAKIDSTEITYQDPTSILVGENGAVGFFARLKNESYRILNIATLGSQFVTQNSTGREIPEVTLGLTGEAYVGDGWSVSGQVGVPVTPLFTEDLVPTSLFAAKVAVLNKQGVELSAAIEPGVGASDHAVNAAGSNGDSLKGAQDGYVFKLAIPADNLIGYNTKIVLSLSQEAQSLGVPVETVGSFQISWNANPFNKKVHEEKQKVPTVLVKDQEVNPANVEQFFALSAPFAPTIADSVFTSIDSTSANLANQQYAELLNQNPLGR